MRVLVGAAALFAANLGVAAAPFCTRSTPSVDLGYAVYEGTEDATNGINIFKRYFPVCRLAIGLIY